MELSRTDFEHLSVSKMGWQVRFIFLFFICVLIMSKSLKWGARFFVCLL
jgi:hypothetical protein